MNLWHLWPALLIGVLNILQAGYFLYEGKAMFAVTYFLYGCAGVTLAAASSMEKDLRSKTGADKDAAAAVGKLVAERAVQGGVKEVIFDRGQYLYHGRVKALADAAREGGLSF